MTRLATPLFGCLALFAAVNVSCDDDEGDGSSTATLMLGQFCDPGFASDCPKSLCRDAVGGESCDNISCTDWSQASNQGTICTRSCSTDDDCAGLDFATVAEEQVSSEEWFCQSGVCNVLVTAPEGMMTDICAGCGGVFCSGRCIGCPQC